MRPFSRQSVGLCIGVLPVFLFWLIPGVLIADMQPDVFKVDDIVISGNRRITTEAIEEQIKAKAGRITKEEITQDIKNIYRTGFFNQVAASIVRPSESEGPVVLKYTVSEKPVVRKVLIRGNDAYDDDDLREELDIEPRRSLDKAQIRALEKKLEVFYQGKGYYDASVDHEISVVSESQFDLIFNIVEGKKYKIRRISIYGLKDVDEDDLLDAIETKRYKWWSSWIFGTGRLNREMLDNDRNLMRQFLLDHGYVDATVSEPVIEKKKKGLYISFKVSEGPLYRIGKVSVSGDLIGESPEKTLKGVKTKPGEIFSASHLRKDSFVVSDKFTDIGYAYANVVPNTSVRRDEKLVDVEFTVDKGQLTTVGEIKIRGNDKTYDHVIRREMVIDEQSLYSSSKIERSRVLLQRLGYFEEVSITNEQGASPDEVDLTVNVREASTGTISAGAGFSSADGIIFNTSISENNLLGTGRKLKLSADVGSRRNNVVLSFGDRRINDSYWSGGIDLLSTKREFTDFDRHQLGGSLRAGYPLDQVFNEWARDIDFILQYRFLKVEINNVDENAAQFVKDEEGKTTLSSLTPRLVRNTIDNPLNPSEGSRQSLSIEGAGLGGDEKFYLIEASNQYYQPLFDTSYGKFVFSLRTRFGYGKTFNGDKLPLFSRFFPGGINSVRGFKSRTLGPKDKDGNEFGGSKQVINNAELLFPIVASAGLQGVLFYDIGQAFDDNESITFSGLRQAWGYGIRWASPLGPIRIEFGRPIDREKGEDSTVTMFSFGAPL